MWSIVSHSFFVKSSVLDLVTLDYLTWHGYYRLAVAYTVDDTKSTPRDIQHDGRILGKVASNK